MNEEVKPNLTNLPLRFSEASFRRYERHIHAIVINFPRPVSFRPESASLETFSCRLRDAITSHITYKWPSSIDPVELSTIRGKIVVQQREGMVVVGPRKTTDAPVEEVKADAGVPGTFPFTVENPSLVELHAFATLLGNRRISGPVKLINASTADIGEVLKAYDVQVVEEGDYLVMI